MKEAFLTTLRNSTSSLSEFRTAAHQLASLLATDAASLIPLEPGIVHTPLGSSQGATLPPVSLMVILRAGLILLPAFQKLFPEASIGFFGIRREEETALPRLYYQNLPQDLDQNWIILLDPMLATGGSAHLALQHLKESGAALNRTILVSVLAAQEGVDRIKKQFSAVSLVTAAIDPALNAKKFIVPGLGDFGDRYFDTT